MDIHFVYNVTKESTFNAGTVLLSIPKAIKIAILVQLLVQVPYNAQKYFVTNTHSEGGFSSSGAEPE